MPYQPFTSRPSGGEDNEEAQGHEAMNMLMEQMMGKEGEESMTINKYWLYSAPDNLDGLVMVVDAYTATTNIALMLSKKPKRMIVVNENNWRQAQKMYSDSLLVGESLTLSASVFAVSNMTSEVGRADLVDKTVLYMTMNGTRALEKYGGRNRVICCAFNNLKRVGMWVRGEDGERVNIIMAGDGASEVLEDKLCAEMLEKEILGQDYHWDKLAKLAREFIVDYYLMPVDWQENLRLVFSLNEVGIIGECLVNKQGFLEVRRR